MTDDLTADAPAALPDLPARYANAASFGWPVPADTDRVSQGAAAIRALADAIAATVGDRYVIRTTVTPDANGNVAVNHGLGGDPATLVVQAALVGPATGNIAAATTAIRSVDGSQVIVRVFRPDGTPFSGSPVTLHLTVERGR